MAVNRVWDPWSDLLQTSRAMDRIFDEFLGDGGRAPVAGTTDPPVLFLPLDIEETESAYRLTASVPGFAPDAVDVTFSEGVLTILAKAEPISREGTWLRRERPHGSLLRRLQLPAQVDPGGIEAAFENGVLTVSVPKLPKPKAVRIPVGQAVPKQIAGEG